MKRAGELRRQAERYRRLELQIGDPAAVRALSELAGEFDKTAEEIEKQQRVRERAHEIWVERGWPAGCDVEFWLTAEQELEGLHEGLRR
jgi:hypothetical protein